MKTNMPHRHLRESRIWRLKAADWYQYFSGDSNSWTHPDHPELKFTMGKAIEAEIAKGAKRETEGA